MKNSHFDRAIKFLVTIEQITLNLMNLIVFNTRLEKKHSLKTFSKLSKLC